MLELVVVLSIAVVCCSVLLAFGCVCHLFKRNGFKSFEDEESGRDVSMQPTNAGSRDTSNVTFEPLPDILAKTVSSRALRPRITCANKEKQQAAAKLVTIYKPFPRNQLIYVKEIGLGWFGQVLQGSAENIELQVRHSKVVVKILKDDATSSDKALFLEEVAPYREMDHTNVLQLLGQCTETAPFLAVLEFPQLGDLKTYLLTNNTGPLAQFALDAANALAYMHQHSYIHHDLAARNCLLTTDLRLKIGDYGIGEDLYREDYYDTGRDLLPIRWMSPESLEVKQGVWCLKEFTFKSNVWSLSVLLWEILAVGRKPYLNLRDEDVLHKVVREGTTKLPPPDTEIPLHDRWFEVLEMCWQDSEDRPTAEDILAFLQQIEEEVTSQSHDSQTGTSRVLVNQTGILSPRSTDGKFVMSKSLSQTNQHVAEVLVHRVDDGDTTQGFDDDFSKSVKIRKNQNSSGFEDDFVTGEGDNVNNSSSFIQNDSILAYGGSPSKFEDEIELEQSKDVFSADHNLNLLHPPVPVGMSTPSKQLTNAKSSQSEVFSSALSSQASNNTKYITASDGVVHASAFNSDLVRSTTESVSPFNPDFVKTNTKSKHSSKQQLFSEKSDNENRSDEGYRTDVNGTTPDLVITSQTDSVKCVDKLEVEEMKTRLSPKLTDIETEKAKELYMSKGIGMPISVIQKSRSLGTIPEDGIPSDNTSQSGIVFDDPDSEDVGLNFEWDDYEGEQLVGRVRYSSDELISTRSPRQVEVEEWPFDQDSSSETHSRPGSLAGDSDAEYDNDLDSPEHASSDSDHWDQSPADPDDLLGPTLPVIEEEGEITEDSEDYAKQEQDGHLIKEDLDKIAASVLRKDNDVPDVIISEARMLPHTLTDSVA